MPSEPDSPDAAYEKRETRDRVRAAIQSLPWRERKVIGLYYYGEVTMKQIGAEIGVNESRVSQLHARAIRRLRDALGDMNPQKVAEMRRQLIAFAAKKPMAKAPMLAGEGAQRRHRRDRGAAGRSDGVRQRRSRRRSRRARCRGRQALAVAVTPAVAAREATQPQASHVRGHLRRTSQLRVSSHGPQQIAEPERLRQPAAAALLEKLLPRRCRRRRR